MITTKYTYRFDYITVYYQILFITYSCDILLELEFGSIGYLEFRLSRTHFDGPDDFEISEVYCI